MRIVQDIAPQASASKTQGAVSDQGYTYNQAGFSYNQPDVTYGGLYGFSTVFPTISLATLPTPTILGARLQMIPINALTSSPVPSIVGYADIYTTPGTATGGTLMGILGLTYP